MKPPVFIRVTEPPSAGPAELPTPRRARAPHPHPHPHSHPQPQPHLHPRVARALPRGTLATAWAELRPAFALFAAPHRRLLAGGALLAATTVLAGVALLGLAGWFITATALAGASAAAALTFDVFAPAAAIRALALLRTGARYAERLVTHDATLAVLAALRERLFRAWARPAAARTLLARPARLLFRLTADIDALDAVYLRLLVPAGVALTTALVSGLALSLLVDPWLGVGVGAGLVGGGFGVCAWAARRAHRVAQLRAVLLEALRARTIDLVAGQTELVMAGRLQAQCAALRSADRRLARADTALHRIETGAAAAHGMVAALLLAGTLAAVAALVEGGRIDAPRAALAVLVALAATEPFAALRRGAVELGRTRLAVRRLLPSGAAASVATAAVPATTTAAAGPAPPAPAPATSAAKVAAAAAAAAPQPLGAALARGTGSRGHDALLCCGNDATGAPDIALRLADITLRHVDTEPAFIDRLSMRLASGERVALIGASGAGKSTLLALVAGEIAPQAGRVEAQRCCLLTQRTELFQDSLRDNLLLADPAADDVRLWQVLEAAGLAADVRALPAGLATMLGEGGLGLSGGQARRLALARLLLRPVPLWLLDEPTDGLDAATAHDALRRLVQAAGARTVLIATHLRREAALAERLLCIEHGRIVAQWRRGAPGFETALAGLRPD